VTAKQERGVIDITYLPEYDGYKYLIIIIDAFTKKAWGRPSKKKDAESVILFLKEVLGDEVISSTFYFTFCDKYRLSLRYTRVIMEKSSRMEN
jgi:hypothetical protein